jgi:hypothetical protein
MGNNSAYTAFEFSVIAAYDHDKLDEPFLRALAEPYRGVDIDSGGSMDLRTKDGKDLEEALRHEAAIDAINAL